MPAGAQRGAKLDVHASAHRSPGPIFELRDGRHVLVRDAEAADEQRLAVFLGRLSPEARRLRFFSGAVDPVRAAHESMLSAAAGRGVVACDGAGAIVAHAIYVKLDGASAEVAVEVADDHQRCGLGTVLVERLAEAAERAGIERFVAEVLPENGRMLDLFRMGFDARCAFRDGVEVVEFPTSAWHLAYQRFLRSRR